MNKESINGLKIRWATNSDLESILKLMVQVFGERGLTKITGSAVVEKSGSLCAVVEHDGQVIANAGIMYNTFEPEMVVVVELRNIATHPDYRRLGIQHALLRWVNAQIRVAHSNYSVYTTANGTVCTSSVDFYKRIGFDFEPGTNMLAISLNPRFDLASIVEDESIESLTDNQILRWRYSERESQYHQMLALIEGYCNTFVEDDTPEVSPTTAYKICMLLRHSRITSEEAHYLNVLVYSCKRGVKAREFSCKKYLMSNDKSIIKELYSIDCREKLSEFR